MSEFSRALIIKLRHHGDVLLTTPLISALHDYFPGIKVDVLIYQETADMLQNNSQVDQLWKIDRNNNRESLFNRIVNERQLVSSLRSRHYDLLIHLTESWRGATLSRLLHTKRSIGFAYPRRDNFLWRRSFTDLVPLPKHHCHNVELQLSTLTALGITPDAAKFPLRLEIQSAARDRVHQFLQEAGWQSEPYVLIHPGSRWLFKCWEDERFAEVIDALTEHGYPVVLTAAPDQRELAMLTQIQEQLIGKGQVYSLAGKLSLAELAAAIAGAKLFIGVDSVPMHMAAALQVPSVALFGPSKVYEWSPWLAPTALLHAEHWVELPHPDSIDTNTSERYLSAIPADAVIKAALTWLDKDPVSS